MVALIRVRMLKNAPAVAQRTKRKSQSEVTQTIETHMLCLFCYCRHAVRLEAHEHPFCPTQKLACPLNRLLGNKTFGCFRIFLVGGLGLLLLDIPVFVLSRNAPVATATLTECLHPPTPCSEIPCRKTPQDDAAAVKAAKITVLEAACCFKTSSATTIHNK